MLLFGDFLSQKKKRLIHLFEKKMDDALTKILGPTIHASGPVMDHKRSFSYLLFFNLTHKTKMGSAISGSNVLFFWVVETYCNLRKKNENKKKNL